MTDHPQTCSDIQANLPLYVGEDLEAPILETVASHLEDCGTCRGIARGLEASRERIGGLSAVGGGPDLWPGVRARLEADGLLARRGARGRIGDRGAELSTAAAGTPRGRLVKGAFGRFGIGLGAVAAAAALVGMVLLSRSQPTPIIADLSDAGLQTGSEGAATSIGVGTDSVAGGLRLVPLTEKRMLEEAVDAGNMDAGAPVFVWPGASRQGQLGQPAGGARAAGHIR